MTSTSLLQLYLHSVKFKSSVFHVQPFVTEEPVAKNFSINNMVMEERMRQGQPPPWHEEDEIDSTRVSTSIVDAVV